MRKLLTAGILAIFAVVALASTASADIIYIGQLDYNQTDFGNFQAGQFTVTNQTGANQQPGFPVITQLLFNADLALVVDGNPALTQGSGLSSNVDGISWDSDAFFVDSFAATLSGTIDQLVINVFGIGMMNVLDGGQIYLEGGSLSGSPLANLDFTRIYINAAPVVPEPATMLIFATGIAGLVARRRATAKR